MLVLILLLFAVAANGENWAIDFISQDDNFRIRNGLDSGFNRRLIMEYPWLEFENVQKNNAPQENYDICKLVCEDLGNLCLGFVFCAGPTCDDACMIGFNKALAEQYKPDLVNTLESLSNTCCRVEEQVQVMGKTRPYNFKAAWNLWYDPQSSWNGDGGVFDANQPADAASKDYYAVKRLSGDDTDTVMLTGPPSFSPISLPPTDPPSTPTGFPTAAPVRQPTFSPTPKPTPFPTLDYGDIKPGGYIGLGLFALTLLVFLAYVAYVYYYQ